MTEIKVGDTVQRIIGCEVFMELKVTSIKGGRIICGPWEFDAVTGGEIDEDLGWTATRSGSFITKEMQ